MALVIAPTRELVAQIAKEAKAFAKPLGLNALAVFGGSGAFAGRFFAFLLGCGPVRHRGFSCTHNGG